MTNTALGRLLALTATTGLALSLAACGRQPAQQNQASLLSPAATQPGWSMNDLAGVDPRFLQAAPLPQALPMRASYRGGYDYAPAYDYGPAYYDDGYDENAGADDYQWLALAAALGGMLGYAPPDYAFGYDGVEPWAWETGDGYLRYAEPIDGGYYRYYYYQPDSYTPFLVSDPYYSYGYRGDRLVAIYDRSGRVIDAARAERQRQAAQSFFARAQQMYVAAHREPRVGVPATLWQRHRDQVARVPRQWDRARSQRPAWQQWDARNEPKLHRDWAGEALVRRQAERSFAGWQKADFKTPPPRFYSPQQRQAQLQRVVALRQNGQGAARQGQQRRAAVPQQLAVQQQRTIQQQRGPAGERTQQVRQPQGPAQRIAERRQAQTQGARVQQQVQQQARLQQAVQRRQAEVQRGQARQQQQVRGQRMAQQRQARAQQATAQRQAQQRAQQQASRVAEQRQQAVARQARQQASRAAAESRQQAVRAQAQQARAAQQQRQAQARQAEGAQRQAQQQARAAQQQQARQAAAKQRSAQPAAQAHGNGGGGGGGHGHKHG